MLKQTDFVKKNERNQKFEFIIVGGTVGYFISARGVVSGQILIALTFTRKTKKRSSKSDYY